MGFGTLFIGYFFLINVTHFFFTDIIAATVMLMGLYKLSKFNRGFYSSFIFCGIFSVFSLVSFITNTMTSFLDAKYLLPLTPYVNMTRHIIVFSITLSMLIGLYSVAREVEANRLALTAKISIPFSLIFLLNAALELPAIVSLLGNSAVIFYGIDILALILLVAANLVTIYKAYMQICMPEDLEPKTKKSGGIFSKFTQYEEKKSREYAEYRINKSIEKAKKRKKKK